MVKDDGKMPVPLQDAILPRKICGLRRFRRWGLKCVLADEWLEITTFCKAVSRQECRRYGRFVPIPSGRGGIGTGPVLLNIRGIEDRKELTRRMIWYNEDIHMY
jgi:hypothetical protein